MCKATVYKKIIKYWYQTQSFYYAQCDYRVTPEENKILGLILG